jgi:hypothetical protein
VEEEEEEEGDAHVALTLDVVDNALPLAAHFTRSGSPSKCYSFVLQDDLSSYHLVLASS